MSDGQLGELRLGVSGYVDARTGIGVLQRHVYPLLERRVRQLVLCESRQPTSNSVPERCLGFVRGIASIGHEVDAFIGFVPPYPYGVKVPSAYIIHDLRWLRTRGRISRAYRTADLLHSFSTCDQIIAISRRTRDDILNHFDPSTSVPQTTIAHLGPGISTSNRETSAEDNSVLLIGRAPHKKNLEALMALREISDSVDRINLVNVSDSVLSLASQFFSPEQVVAHGEPSNRTLVDIYNSSRVFVSLSEDEGFGLPYLEALAQGCRVVAVDQPLTREVLGDGAKLVQSGDLPATALAVRESFEPSSALEMLCIDDLLSRYTWESFADSCLSSISRALAGGTHSGVGRL